MKRMWTLGPVLAAAGLALGQAAPTPSSGPAPQVYHVGGDVKPPVPLFMPDPDFSKEARKKKMSGSVLVRLIVDAEGHSQQVHVVRSLADQVGKKDQKAALSLNQEALEAVQQYRFKPATRDGQAVPVEMNVEVNFTIF